MIMFKFFQELYLKHSIVKFLVRSRLKEDYSNKFLGFFWSILDPLALMIAYYILVQYIFQRGSENLPALLFSALLAWKSFGASLSESVTTLTGRSKIILSVACPKAVFPLSGVITHFIRYLFGMLALIPILALFGITPGFSWFWLPLLMVLQLMMTFGLSLFFSIVGVYFTDISNVISLLLRFLLYACPIIYMARDRVSAKHLDYYMLNPLAPLFESYKSVLVLREAPSAFLPWTAVCATAILVFGVYFFRHFEHRVTKSL